VVIVESLETDASGEALFIFIPNDEYWLCKEVRFMDFFWVREKTKAGQPKGEWEKGYASSQEEAALKHSQMVAEREKKDKLVRDVDRILQGR